MPTPLPKRFRCYAIKSTTGAIELWASFDSQEEADACVAGEPPAGFDRWNVVDNGAPEVS